MQICFIFKKKNNCSHANLLTFKKNIITITQKQSYFNKTTIYNSCYGYFEKERDITCIITSQEKT